MEDGTLYYLWLYLPNKIKLPPYDRTKERRDEIYNTILASLHAGEAKLYRAGLNSPDENVIKSHDEVQEENRFTSVILKYYSTEELDFGLSDEALVQLFIKLLEQSEEVILIGDNTRMLVDADEYRLVTLEGRKTWLPEH